MPTGGERWFPTRQPIVMDLWPVEPGDIRSPFTTVMNWSPLPDQEYEGHIYGQKDREFEKFFSLPSALGESMQIAVNLPVDVRERLLGGGWKLADPAEVTRDVPSYQRFLRASRAEFSVAKHGYVVTRCGWFSERSAAYLASGRPVVVQDTGFSEWLKTGCGVIAFKNPNEAIAGIEEINRRYDCNCVAARQIAEEYFDSRKVLSEMLERAINSA